MPCCHISTRKRTTETQMPPPAEGFAARFVLGPALRTQPDRRLVSLVREGYETAFEEIVRRYGRPLTRYAAAIVGSRGEDVTQDAFSKALLALRDTAAEIELRPWLFRIVRNTALNELRDHPPTPEVLAEAIAGSANPAEELERREELADLMRRLQSLPEPQRAAIVMRELEGLGHEEIAAALGLSGGAARQAIYRARRALRDGLGLMLPLPLLKTLLAGGAVGGAEIATAGAAGAGGAGAGAALKAATATVLVAGAVGTGVAVQETREGSNQAGAQAQRVAGDDLASPVASPQANAAASGGHDFASNTGEENRGPGGGERSNSGDDRRGDRDEQDDSDSGPGSDRDREDRRLEDLEEDRSGSPDGFDDRSGPGDGSGSVDRSGPSHGDGANGGGAQRGSLKQGGGSSGPGSDSSGPGSGSGGDADLEDRSGPGDGSLPTIEDEIELDGGGSSSSGSGSGSGSGGDDPLDS